MRGTGGELARVAHVDAVTSVAFSSNGRWLATGGTDNVARVWLLDEGDGGTTASRSE